MLKHGRKAAGIWHLLSWKQNDFTFSSTTLLIRVGPIYFQRIIRVSHGDCFPFLHRVCTQYQRCCYEQKYRAMTAHRAALTEMLLHSPSYSEIVQYFYGKYSTEQIWVFAVLCFILQGRVCRYVLMCEQRGE